MKDRDVAELTKFTRMLVGCRPMYSEFSGGLLQGAVDLKVYCRKATMGHKQYDR